MVSSLSLAPPTRDTCSKLSRFRPSAKHLRWTGKLVRRGWNFDQAAALRSEDYSQQPMKHNEVTHQHMAA